MELWDPGGGLWPAALCPTSPRLDTFPRMDGKRDTVPPPLNGSWRQVMEQGAGPAGQASPALTLNCVSEWVPTHARVAALAFAPLRLPMPSACTLHDSSACLATVSLAPGTPGPASCVNLGDPCLSRTCPARGSLVVAENGAKEHRVDRLVWRGGVEVGQTGLGRKAGAPPPPSPVKDTGVCMLGAGGLPRCLCFVI